MGEYYKQLCMHGKQLVLTAQSCHHQPKFFTPILSPGACGGIRTLNPMIMSRVFYHCANVAQHNGLPYYTFPTITFSLILKDLPDD